MSKPILIEASRKDISPRVVVVGDPTRAEQLASLLKEPRLVSRNRGYAVYTGHFSGKSVTIATHGIGGPSAAIIIEELRFLGAKTIIRLGTCGSMMTSLRRGDFLVPSGAAHYAGSLNGYLKGEALPAIASPNLTLKLIEGCKSREIRFMAGLVFSTDVFYNEDKEFVNKWTRRGALGVDMECATLFTLGLIRGFMTGALLMVSDSLVSKSEKDVLGPRQLRNNAIKAGKIVLNVITE